MKIHANFLKKALPIAIILLQLLFVTSYKTSASKRRVERIKSDKSEVQSKNRFRMQASSVAKASRKFYSNLKRVKAGELKKIENSSWLSVGYNIVFGNPIIAPQNGKLIDSGFTTTIFKQKFEQNNKTPDEFYIFPDGFEVQPAKVCKTNFSSQTIKTSKSLKKSMETSLGVGGNYYVYSFMGNEEYNSMSQSMKNEDKLYISNSASCSIYRTTLNKYNPPEFNDNFMAALKSLDNTSYENNKETYFNFIQIFGTHFLYETMMGSRYTYVEETTNTSLNELKSSGVNIANQAKYSAMNSIEVKQALKSTKENEDKYGSIVTNRFVTSVGAPMPASMDMNDWLRGTNHEPMPISYLIKPIPDILTIEIVKKRLKEAGLDADELSKNLKIAHQNYCSALAEKKIIASCESEKTDHIAKEDFYTEFQDDGSGDIFKLTNHLINCGANSALNYFNMQRGDKTIRYAYKCVKSEHISNTCVDKETPPNDVYYFHSYSSDYLGKHKIECPPDNVIRSMGLARNGNKVYYKYKCCVAKVKFCFTFNSPKSEKGDKSTYNLVHQIVDASANHVLNELTFISSELYHYEASACKLFEKKIQ